MIGGVFFGIVKQVELTTKRRFPAWIIVPLAAVVAAVVYRAFTIALMI